MWLLFQSASIEVMAEVFTFFASEKTKSDNTQSSSIWNDQVLHNFDMPMSYILTHFVLFVTTYMNIKFK